MESAVQDWNNTNDWDWREGLSYTFIAEAELSLERDARIAAEAERARVRELEDQLRRQGL